MSSQIKAHYHLPGLFEFVEFYKVFLPLYAEHKDWFYDWCDIGSIYGAPADCLWGGGRVGFGVDDADELLQLMDTYGISARLTFSNSLLRDEHLGDAQCNRLCEQLSSAKMASGVIVHSDLLAGYVKDKYPSLYLVSSTTKVLTKWQELESELARDEFKYVVPDFRLNKSLDNLSALPEELKDKVEFLCNECCNFGCKDRRECYINVSHKALGDDVPDHICTSPDASLGYRFSSAMKNPGFIGIEDIVSTYLPMGFTNFKIEGRSLGSAILLEFILYYMTRPEYHLNVREMIYLDSSLDLF